MIAKSTCFSEFINNFLREFILETKNLRESSNLLFIYYLFCLIVSLPFILLPETVQSKDDIFRSLWLLFILFSIISSSIFSREISNNMTEFLFMKINTIKSTFYLRLMINFIIISFPILLSLFITDVLYFRILFSLYSLFSFFSCIFLLYFWFLVAMNIFIFLNILFEGEIMRFLIFIVSIILFLAILSFISDFIYPTHVLTLISNFIFPTNKLTAILFFDYPIYYFYLKPVFTGKILFEYPMFNLVILIIPIFLFQKSLSILIDIRFKILKQNYNYKKTYSTRSKSIIDIFKVFIEKIKFKSKKSRSFIVILVFFFYIIAISFGLILIVVYTHILITFIYLLAFVLPNVIAEKQFNMEEMILAVVNTKEYYMDKIISLLNPSFFTIFPLLIFIIPFMNLNSYIYYKIEASKSIPILIPLFFISHIFYLVSIILLIWRLLPMKNQYQNSLIALLGFDFFVNYLVVFLLPEDKFFSSLLPLITITPLSSFFLIVSMEINYTTETMLKSSIGLTSIITLILLITSYSLTRETRFE